MGIEDGQFAHATLGKKIKFTHVSNTPKLIRGNFIQAIHSESNSSRYFTLDDLTSLSYDKKNDFSLFHLNINTLQYHFDKFHIFLSNCPIDFQILGISKSRLKPDISTTTSMQLPGFNIEHIPTKSANGGALLYIKDTINYKLRPELESIFIEILPKTSKNIIIGCIYKHPCMYPKEFNDLFLKYVTERLTKENNIEVILLGGFNIDLIKSQMLMHQNSLM